MAVRRSLAFAFLDRYTGLVTGIVSSIILARLLSPAEVGVFSIVMVMLGLVNTLRDMGAGQYLLQEKELTPDRIRAVWTVQLGLGTLLAAIVAGASPAVAAFYDEPRMTGVMLVLAFNYLINPVGSITYAWLMREMRFDALAIIRFVSTICGSVLSIVLAWRGHGPISLAWGSLAGTVAGALISALYRPAGYPWLPGLSEVRRVLSFGSKVSLASIVGSTASGFPEFYIGKLFGMAATGHYSRANGLVSMFHRLVTDAMGNVALSMFSQKVRDGEDLSEPFVRAFAYITAIGCAFCLSLACLAQPAMLLLYGDQWLDAVPLTRVLTFAVLFGLPVKICHSVVLASGAAGRTLAIATISAIVSIGLGVIGGSFSVMGFAVASVVSCVVSTGLWLRLARSVVAYRWVDLRRASLSSAGVGLVASIGPAVVYLIGTSVTMPAAVALAFGGLTSMIGFLTGLVMFKHPLLSEVTPLGQRLRSRIGRKS